MKLSSQAISCPEKQFEAFTCRILCLSIMCFDLGIALPKICKKVIDLNVFGEQIDRRRCSSA